MSKHRDCFDLNIKILKYIGVWPTDNSILYKIYSIFCITLFNVIFFLTITFNLFFASTSIEVMIEDSFKVFSVLQLLIKLPAVLFSRDKIDQILDTFDDTVFQPKNEEEREIIEKTKKYHITFLKSLAVMLVSGMMFKVLPSLLVAHIIRKQELVLGASSYKFIDDEIRNRFIYALFLYQTLGIIFDSWFHTCVDTLLSGIIGLVVAQLEIIDRRLRALTDGIEPVVKTNANSKENDELDLRFIDCIVHYTELNKLVDLIQDTFDSVIFANITVAACIICVVCLRFSMPLISADYFSLGAYFIFTTLMPMVQCTLGTRLSDKSEFLANAIYDCDWTPRSRRFKQNMRLFVERAHKPLCLTGGKIFRFSLITFSTIINTTYSLFTLVQSQK